jgi:hypothetical protein
VIEKSRGAQLPLKMEMLIVGVEREKILGKMGINPER